MAKPMHVHVHVQVRTCWMHHEESSGVHALSGMPLEGCWDVVGITHLQITTQSYMHVHRNDNIHVVWIEKLNMYTLYMYNVYTCIVHVYM